MAFSEEFTVPFCNWVVELLGGKSPTEIVLVSKQISKEAHYRAILTASILTKVPNHALYSTYGLHGSSPVLLPSAIS